MGDETASNNTASALKVDKKKRKDEKYRKRDPKSWENVLRATANMSPEEKLQYLENAYNELYNENKTTSANLLLREKQYAQTVKEHEKDRAELTKSILAKGQLESLCRELQKQNKLIKEENVARIKEEEDRRREVANTFTERLNALTNLITESKDKSNKVKEENQNMAVKLSELYEQYQQRETHLETVTRQLDLQKKLADTKAKKVEIEYEAERQTFQAQKKAMEVQLEQYEREIILIQEKNKGLEAQVELYKSQYSDFETTMSKSNKVFDTFKGEMAKMSKHVSILESERNDLKKKWQSSVNSLLALSEQHMAMAKEQNALEKKIQMLEKLCRQLQDDRTAFWKQLKDNSIEPIIPSSIKEALKQETDESKSHEASTVLDSNNLPLTVLSAELKGDTSELVQKEMVKVSLNQNGDQSSSDKKPKKEPLSVEVKSDSRSKCPTKGCNESLVCPLTSKAGNHDIANKTEDKECNLKNGNKPLNEETDAKSSIKEPLASSP
ncbi:alpha-taxilin [Anthonomus grandis grandis]|uniref:alpha-taxilin n=1 Tax=Anthonomus grandis grandis TaxID=2921223 RepID=UPI002166729F|nr:alpha-taxilin [Anthonomus grandis grandis]XP_050314216.1 alpha-taxilin [Anthonomus grandis grandis]